VNHLGFGYYSETITNVEGLLVKKLLVATTLLCLCSANSAKAFTYAESGDSGQLISTAQVVNLSNATSTPTDPLLTSITGSTTSNNADLFGIFLTAGQLFTATTVPTSGVTPYDSQLFLFNGQGFGLVANDNVSGATTLSSINFTPTTTGTYYLAISGFNYDPRDTSGNFIFADTRTGQISPGAGAGALASWATRTGVTSAAFSYNIALTGATPAPEPAMGGGFLAFMALGVSSAFRQKRQVNQ
jgi:Bacterial pre-peptidase C-terminal domain